MQSPHSKHRTEHRTSLQSHHFKLLKKNPSEMNYLLQGRGDVPGFNPYMNNKYVHIGHAQIFSLFVISAWVLNSKLPENLF